MAERVSVSLEHCYAFENGRARWLDMRASPTADGALAVFWRDVTDRREAQEALRESEARYRLLFASIESGFCVVEVDLHGPNGRLDYRVIEANPAFYRHTGFPKAILGCWLREAAPDLEEHWFEIYGRVARTGEPERFEQGSGMLGRWFDVYAFRTSEPAQRRVAILFNDISARRNSELALQESETRFRNMADQAPVMMWVTDADARCTYLNRSWYEFTGQSEAEGEGFGWLQAVHPDDQGWSGEVFLAASAKQEPFRLEYRLRRADGVYRWAIDAASPRLGPNGEFLGYVGSTTDEGDVRDLGRKPGNDAGLLRRASPRRPRRDKCGLRRSHRPGASRALRRRVPHGGQGGWRHPLGGSQRSRRVRRTRIGCALPQGHRHCHRHHGA
jgi:PAS domain S-box-containing protein